MSKSAEDILKEDFESEFKELNIKIPDMTLITDLSDGIRCINNDCNKKAVYRQLNKTYCWYHAFIMDKNKK